MASLIVFLIIIFILLIVYQVFLAFKNEEYMLYLEGFTSYEEYDTEDLNNKSPLVQKNINNISYLNSEIIDMSGNMAKMQQQINSLANQQNDYLNQMTGGTPLNITGTD
jgi:hypothetical protein